MLQTNNMTLPPEFISRVYKDFPHSEADLLIQTILAQKAPVSIRKNPNKKLEIPWEKQVAWNNLGRYLPERISFIEDPNWHAGAYYVQEASSMFLSHIIQQINLSENAIVLDSCAAPGGKSTLILSHLSDNATLVANEIIPNRNTILRENLIRWGHANLIVTQSDVNKFSPLNEFFDAVFVDAPCSGEGLFRRDPNSIQEWSVNNTEICTQRQKQILANLHNTIKPGGYLIYSTCTFNESENFEASSILLEHDFEKVDIDISSFKGISKEEKMGVLGYAFRPGNIEGEGFFVSVFRKKGSPDKIPTRKLKIVPKVCNESNYLPKDKSYFPFKIGGLDFIVPESTYWVLRSLPQIKITYVGIEAGISKDTYFIPSHALAYQKDLLPEVPRIELDLNEALSYLKKESIQPRPELERGIYLVCYKGNGLGWAKNIGSRFNNLLPIEFRIKKAL